MQALSIAAAGMMAAADRLSSSAQRVAAAGAQAERVEQAGGVDYVSERTQQITAEVDFAANAAVARTADQMSGALLDLKV